MIQDSCWIPAIVSSSKQEEGGQRRSKRGALSTQVSPWNVPLSSHTTLTFHLLEFKSLALVQVKEAVLLALSDRQEQELGETVLSVEIIHLYSALVWLQTNYYKRKEKLNGS